MCTGHRFESACVQVPGCEWCPDLDIVTGQPLAHNVCRWRHDCFGSVLLEQQYSDDVNSE